MPRYFHSSTRKFPLRLVSSVGLLVLLSAVLTSSTLAANVSCAVVTPHPISDTEKAYLDGKYDTAATLYRQQLAQKPNDPELTAGLAEALLQQSRLQEADDLVHKAVAQNPTSVVLQTSLGLVQYREGTPWLASDTAVQAMKIDPCYPQLRFLRARLLQLNSNFASGAREIAIAHTLDPHDPRIRLRWLETLPLNQRISELETYLSDATGDNPERLASLQKYLAYLKGEVPGQDSKAASERRTCHLVSNTTATSIPLQRLMWGGATIQATAQLGSESNQQAPIRAYALDVKINDHNTRLEIDTGASGLLISQSVADKAGLKKVFDEKVGGIGDQGSVAAYTAYADSIKIGELEFHDCQVEVVEKRNVAGSEGLIGMDVLSHFLLTLDFPMRKLILAPLPPRPDDTAPAQPALDTLRSAEPGEGTDSQADHAKSPAAPVALHDRYVAPDMKDWTPVYRAGHFLLMPTMLNDNRRRIFILDTGANHSSIDPAVASEFTKLRARDDIEIRGLSGKVKTMKVFTADDVVFKFGGISHENMDVTAFDSPGMSEYAGMQLAGLIGFSTLSQTTVKIDYRDALVHFTYEKNRGYVDQQNPY